MAADPLELLSPEQHAALTEKLKHWELLSGEDAYRVMSSPLMANDAPFFRRVLALETEVAELRKLTGSCVCYDGNPQNYDGPYPECPVHGAIRAANEAWVEIAGLKRDLDLAQRDLDLSQKTIRALTTPTKGGA